MAASLSMCLKANGLDMDEDTVNKVMGARPMQGASWEQALAAAQHFGMRATLIAPCTLSQLKAWTDAKVPVMIAWNPEGRPWSHASVVFDVTDGGEVHVADPNIPNPEETVRVVTTDEFFKLWGEKWPDYIVRRPAMAIEREVTQEGKQMKLGSRQVKRGSEDLYRFLRSTLRTPFFRDKSNPTMAPSPVTPEMLAGMLERAFKKVTPGIRVNARGDEVEIQGPFPKIILKSTGLRRMGNPWVMTDPQYMGDVDDMAEFIADQVAPEQGRRAGYTGNPGGKDIYPNQMDHGYNQPLAGGTDVMVQLQNQLVTEQGHPEWKREQSPRLAGVQSMSKETARKIASLWMAKRAAPEGPQVTIYMKGALGIDKVEGVLTGVDNHGVDFIKRRARRESRIMTYYSPFIMVVKGWGLPDPDSPWGAEEGSGPVTTQRSRYRSTDPRWVTDFLEGPGSSLRSRVIVLFEDGNLRKNDSGIWTAN